MLDSTTKKQIDDLRDILVGKIPDPKSQVEQITTGLIYKFMYDMDEQSREMGGKASFFTGAFKKYSWDRFYDPKLSGQERVKLYSEAIEMLYTHPKAPQFLRDIFKNAFLPFKDPSTLNMFLKAINEFQYSNSEKLGNAYEYLLSFMGSQGNAGQFRTPRHIIDFMVKVVNPQKTETILDPACGTAGFLMSSYKYVLNQNMNEKPGDRLSAAERKQLSKNLVGYDIDPNMVRISLVNMYLHQFTNPQIHEYDTLSSEDRWDEYYDVILANPPFFSPKGGITPHSRFGVKSARAEVLFVDYIMEHLNPRGRAGIIVPEGIIFQTGGAYKTLRKKLVEDCLVGVISLPAGVFQPYSGVKTSILILDKELSRKTDNIFFAKVENDGFSLGANRTPIEKNDLPHIRKAILGFPNLTNSEHVFLTLKKNIAENSDYSLSSGRYTTRTEITLSYPTKKLGEVISLEYGKPLKKEDRKEGEYPVFGSNGIVGYHNEFITEGPCIIVGRKGSAGEVTFSKKNAFPIDTTFFVSLKDEGTALKYIYYALQKLPLKTLNVQAGVPGLNRNDAYKLEIPLPPIDIQQEIVAELEMYQKIIEGNKKLIEIYTQKIQDRISKVWGEN